jgi:hydrogenase expression/formation protein HypC
MCLGIPGKIVEIYEQHDLPMGKIEFGGVAKEICLAYTPEARVDDYVIVHAGFAISCVNEEEAQEIFSYLAQFGETAEVEEKPTPGQRRAGGEPPEAAT